jgi:hypothetical protein
MTMKTFFTIIAVLALLHGVGFVLVPEQVAASYGMTTSASTVLMARLFGAALVALGLILWFARNGSSESVRDVLIAVIIGNTVGLIVVVMGMGRRFDLSFRSSRVCLFRDGTIPSVIVALG